MRSSSVFSSLRCACVCLGRSCGVVWCGEGAASASRRAQSPTIKNGYDESKVVKDGREGRAGGCERH